MYLHNFKQRFNDLKYLFLKSIISCTSEEVQLIEKKLKISLPESYKEFLLWGGHKAGGFMKDYDCFFDDILEIQEAAQEVLAENQSSQELPSNSFVFFFDYGYQFMFFVISNDNSDPPVYAYSQYNAEKHEKKEFFVLKYPSYSSFLMKTLEEEAQKNI
jgi:hypothetical protein